MLNGKLTDRVTQVRFFRFVIVGGLVAMVQFSVLAFARNYWGANASLTAGFILATATHYGLNKIWALPSERRDTGRQFGEYMMTVLLSYLINMGVFNLAHAVLGLSMMWAALCAVPPATLAVFLLLNYRVFRERE